MRQINIDLHRSFGGLIDLDLAKKEGLWEPVRESLRRVLHAYVVHRCTDINRARTPVYVQGMNFMAAWLLVRLDFNEEDAFWLFCFVLEELMDPMFYCYSPRELLGYIATSALLKKYAVQICRWTHRIGEENFSAVLDLVLQKWLFTLFVHHLPFHVLNAFWHDIARTGCVKLWFAWILGILQYVELKLDEKNFSYLLETVDIFIAITDTTTTMDDLETLTACISSVHKRLPSHYMLQDEITLAY